MPRKKAPEGPDAEGFLWMEAVIARHLKVSREQLQVWLRECGASLPREWYHRLGSRRGGAKREPGQGSVAFLPHELLWWARFAVLAWRAEKWSRYLGRIRARGAKLTADDGRQQWTLDERQRQGRAKRVPACDRPRSDTDGR